MILLLEEKIQGFLCLGFLRNDKESTWSLGDDLKLHENENNGQWISTNYSLHEAAVRIRRYSKF